MCFNSLTALVYFCNSSCHTHVTVDIENAHVTTNTNTNPNPKIIETFCRKLLLYSRVATTSSGEYDIR